MGQRIVFAEDSPSQRALVQRWLELGGYEVFPCNDGEEALAKAIETKPDLVLADVNMPNMDGFELCRRLKAGADTSHIPVVLFTRLDEATNILTGLAAGADDFIIKGAKQAELLDRIARVFQETQGTAPRKQALENLSRRFRLSKGRIQILKQLFYAIDREVAFDVLALHFGRSAEEHVSIVVSRHTPAPNVVDWLREELRQTYQLVANRQLEQAPELELIVLDESSAAASSETPRGAVKVPLLDAGQVVGVFGVFRHEPNRQFDDNIRYFFDVGVEAARALRQLWSEP